MNVARILPMWRVWGYGRETTAEKKPCLAVETVFSR